MKKHMTRSEATQTLAAREVHSDSHPGLGAITLPAHEDIARRAYEIYFEDGCRQGRCKDNWHQAEHDFRSGGRPS